MRRVGRQLLCSPLDLASLIACEPLTQLELAVALGKGTRPAFGNAYADLIRRKGEGHEWAFLEELRAAGHAVAQVGLGEGRDFAAAARATVEAIRHGAQYVYQAAFLADGWRGVADFLERVERPSALGPWSYEVLDTKLARHPGPRGDVAPLPPLRARGICDTAGRAAPSPLPISPTSGFPKFRCPARRA